MSGSAHPAVLPASVWTVEREAWAEQGLEDMFLYAGSPNHPVSLLQERLSGHSVISILSGPGLHGHPTKRPRQYGAGLVTGKVVWAGSNDVQCGYDAIFSRSVKLSGDVYLQSTEEQIMEDFKYFAGQQGFNFTTEELKNMSKAEILEHILPPGALIKFKDWVRHRKHGLHLEPCLLGGCAT